MTFLENFNHIIPIPIWAVTALYVVLKFAGYLTLSWWFVFSPIMVSSGLFATMMVICLASMFLKGQLK